MNLLYIFEFVIDTCLQMSLFNFIFLFNLWVYVIFPTKMVFLFLVIFIGFIYTMLCLYAIFWSNGSTKAYRHFKWNFIVGFCDCV